MLIAPNGQPDLLFTMYADYTTRIEKAAAIIEDNPSISIEKALDEVGLSFDEVFPCEIDKLKEMKNSNSLA